MVAQYHWCVSRETFGSPGVSPQSTSLEGLGSDINLLPSSVIECWVVPGPTVDRTFRWRQVLHEAAAPSFSQGASTVGGRSHLERSRKLAAHARRRKNSRLVGHASMARPDELLAIAGQGLRKAPVGTPGGLRAAVMKSHCPVRGPESHLVPTAPSGPCGSMYGFTGVTSTHNALFARWRRSCSCKQ